LLALEITIIKNKKFESING
ncbi:hypothetical protein EVA_16734, partial [gut metagenome]